jgi:hypothetical protein
MEWCSKDTCYTIQRDVLMPVVEHTWSIFQKRILERVESTKRNLRLTGYGRCDSPGGSAKYCSYSLMDMQMQQIISFVTIKVAETGSRRISPMQGLPCRGRINHWTNLFLFSYAELKSTCDLIYCLNSPLFVRNGELWTMWTGAELEFRGKKPQPV